MEQLCTDSLKKSFAGCNRLIKCHSSLMIMEQRESFNDAAALYDEARPSYPDEVIDWVISRTKISKDKTLLEIGAGTGQATIKFAERGYRIHCIEMGRNLADILKQKVKLYDVTVDVSSFEAWEPENPFQTLFIFCATAFHWIDHNVRYKKCHDLLEADGYLVLLWHVLPEIEMPAVKKAFDLLWEYYPKERKVQEAKVDIKNERKLEIMDGGLFTLEHYLDYKWNLPPQTRETITKTFFSQSAYLSLEKEKREVLSTKVEELFKNLDDVVETELYTTVYVAKKK